MRVAYVSHFLDPHDCRFLKSFDTRTDVDIVVVAFVREIPPDVPKFSRVRIILAAHPFFPYDDPWRTEYGPLTSLRIKIGQYYYARKLRKIIEDEHIDIVHAGWIQVDGAVAALSQCRPFLLMPWGSDILINPSRNQATKKLTVRTLKNADFITCDCETVKSRILEMVPDYPPEKFFIMPWGIDTQRFSVRSGGLLMSPPTLVMTRLFQPVYNIPFFIDVLARVREKIPNVRAVLLGDGPQRGAIEARIAQHGLQENVRLVGMVQNNELPRHLREATLYVSTSLSDGTSVSLIEAMGCGLPAVVSHLPANQEWVIPGENGYLIDPHDVNTAASTIVSLLNSPEKLVAMGKAARKTVEARADWASNMDKLVSLYGALTSSLPPTQLHYRQCVRCVMDTEQDTGISFDAEGVCNYCHTWKRRFAAFTFQGEQARVELEKKVREIKEVGAGQKYDCILGVSGGVDSTFVAYQAKSLGFRPLVVHFDNGWNSELSVQNIENIVKKLNLDLYTYVVDWEEFKDLQLAYLKASVIDVEFPTDHGMVALLRRVASQYGIRYILSGYNIATEGVLPTAWRWEKMDLLNLKAIHKALGTRKLKTFPMLGFWKNLYEQLWSRRETVQLLNYFDYDKKKAKELITRELDWRDYGGKHHESIFTRFYQGYILPEKFGIDKRKAHLSSLICSGQISKAEALDELKKPHYDPQVLQSDKLFVSKKLGLTSDQFDHIMKLPIRSHTEFASYTTAHYRYHQELFAKLRPLTRVFRKIFSRAPKEDY